MFQRLFQVFRSSSLTEHTLSPSFPLSPNSFETGSQIFAAPLPNVRLAICIVMGEGSPRNPPPNKKDRGGFTRPFKGGHEHEEV
jgi:hypothetical protein